MKRLLSRALQRAANTLGYAVVRRDAVAITTMESAIRRIAERLHSFGTIVDIGASDGSWSEMAMRFLRARYLLVEAQPVHEPRLREFCARHADAAYALVAAGEHTGTINFDTSDPFGGQASTSAYATANRQLPVTTVDRLVRDYNMPGPYLLKLDTHGYEVPILNGASTVLEQTDVVVVECYNFRIGADCLLFDEMCAHMRRLGFRCIDLVDPYHRPLDNAFWQMDLVFVKEAQLDVTDGRFSSAMPSGEKS
jgi:FkbM family methyltransferase